MGDFHFHIFLIFYDFNNKCYCISNHYSLFFNAFLCLRILFIYVREREGERQGEKHRCAVASYVPLVGDLACNPGLCPDRELNWRPFVSEAGAPSTEPHQPGPTTVYF